MKRRRVKMGFSLGNSLSRYVTVYDVTIKPSYSDKIAFASLCTSSKTGRKDDNGNLILNPKTGKPERKYNYVEGRFVGEALELVKQLPNGTPIDIISGWMETYPKEVGGIKISHPYIVITEFNLSEIEETNEEPAPSETNQSETSSKESIQTEIQDYYSGLNG